MSKESRMISCGVSASIPLGIAQSMIANRNDGWSSLLQTNQDGVIVNQTGTVRYDDYKDLQEDVIKSREFDNVGIQDLMAAGLTQSSSIDKTLVSYETMNTFGAEVSMNGSNRREEQSDYVINYVPQPIYHTDFVVPWRQEGFTYKRGDGIEESVFRVNEKMDEVLFLGADLSVQLSGQAVPLYGYTNHPATITTTISDWTNPANLDAIKSDAIGMTAQLFTGSRTQGPNTVMMYVANDIWPILDDDYSTQKGARTVLERLRAISVISDVKPQKNLPDGSVVMVEMRSRTVQLSVAQMTVAVPWVKSHAIENGRLTIYSSLVAKIKADRFNRTGIIYATKT